MACVSWMTLTGNASEQSPVPQFTDVTARSGIVFQHISGPVDRKDYIFEAKGGGVGLFDYDNDGWLDVFIVQGSTLERHKANDDPHGALYRNNRDGTFTDVTEKAGLTRRAWGMGVTFGDYDNDGWADVILTGLDSTTLYRNHGNGTFTDVTEKAGVGDRRWSSSAAFGDYDRDGNLDLYVCKYIKVDLDGLPAPGSGINCTYLGKPVMCGPRGLQGEVDALYHNNGDGTFSDVSQRSGAWDRDRLFGLGVVWADFDADADLDIYVADDDGPNLLFVNQGDGTFQEMGIASGLAVNADGLFQGSMGIDAADYDNDGRLDAMVTNFSNDYSTLYHNDGQLLFTDVTASADLIRPAWPFVKWGLMLADFDHDGWKDIFHVNGHVAPFLKAGGYAEAYFEPPSFFLNLKNGKFRDVRKEAGADLQVPMCSRGAAFGDIDNDGDIDVVVANLNGAPRLLRNDQSSANHWAMFRTVGRKSNRDGLGVRLTATTGALTQTWETKRGVSIYSASDPRAHFGLGQATRIDLLRVQWPSGKVQELRDIPADQHYLIDEEAGLAKEPIR
jgi:enediyne biosynthesis protein E4